MTRFIYFILSISFMFNCKQQRTKTTIDAHLNEINPKNTTNTTVESARNEKNSIDISKIQRIYALNIDENDPSLKDNLDLANPFSAILNFFRDLARSSPQEKVINVRGVDVAVGIPTKAGDLRNNEVVISGTTKSPSFLKIKSIEDIEVKPGESGVYVTVNDMFEKFPKDRGQFTYGNLSFKLELSGSGLRIYKVERFEKLTIETEAIRSRVVQKLSDEEILRKYQGGFPHRPEIDPSRGLDTTNFRMRQEAALLLGEQDLSIGRSGRLSNGSTYVVKKKIGEGTSGTVFLIEITNPDKSNYSLAIKEMSVQPLKELSQLRELELMEIFNGNPNFVKYYGAFKRGEKLFIAMESLKPLTPEFSIKKARAMARALSEMHNQGIAHFDLKPENMMEDENGVIKFIDFGSSRTTASRGKGESTPVYLAPEYQVAGRIGQKPLEELDPLMNDVYTLGLILFQLKKNSGKNFNDILLKSGSEPALKDGRFLDKVRSMLNPADGTEKLILQMLEKDPAKRPPIQEVLIKLETM